MLVFDKSNLKTHSPVTRSPIMWLVHNNGLVHGIPVPSKRPDMRVIAQYNGTLNAIWYFPLLHIHVNINYTICLTKAKKLDCNLVKTEPQHNNLLSTYILIIIYMKKLLDSDWLRAVQFKCNTSAKSVTPVQKV